MMFEKEKYYKYIKTLERNISIIYILITLLTAVLGIVIAKGIGLILGIAIGILVSNNYTLMAKIKIQKMKWEIDVHQLIREKTKNN